MKNIIFSIRSENKILAENQTYNKLKKLLSNESLFYFFDVKIDKDLYSLEAIDLDDNIIAIVHFTKNDFYKSLEGGYDFFEHLNNILNNEFYLMRNPEVYNNKKLLSFIESNNLTLTEYIKNNYNYLIK